MAFRRVAVASQPAMAAVSRMRSMSSSRLSHVAANHVIDVGRIEAGTDPAITAAPTVEAAHE